MRVLFALFGNFCRLLGISFFVIFTFVVGAVPISALPNQRPTNLPVPSGFDPRRSETVFGNVNWRARKYFSQAVNQDDALDISQGWFDIGVPAGSRQRLSEEGAIRIVAPASAGDHIQHLKFRLPHRDVTSPAAP